MATLVRPTLTVIDYRVGDNSTMRNGWRSVTHQNAVVNIDYIQHFKLGDVKTINDKFLPAILLSVKGYDDWVYWIFGNETEREVNFDLLMAAGGAV